MDSSPGLWIPEIGLVERLPIILILQQDVYGFIKIDVEKEGQEADPFIQACPADGLVHADVLKDAVIDAVGDGFLLHFLNGLPHGIHHIFTGEDAEDICLVRIADEFAQQQGLLVQAILNLVFVVIMDGGEYHLLIPVSQLLQHSFLCHNLTAQVCMILAQMIQEGVITLYLFEAADVVEDGADVSQFTGMRIQIQKLADAVHHSGNLEGMDDL